MTIPLPDPNVIRLEGDLNPSGVQRNFDALSVAISSAAAGGGTGAISAISASNHLFTSGTVRIIGSGDITVSSDASGAIISGSQSVQTQSMVRALSYSNTTSSGTVRITGAGIVTVASDASGAVISATQSVQTQSLVRALSFSNTTMDGTVRITGAGNAVTVASDASGAVISVQTTQTVQPVGSASAAGNTIGTLTAIPLSGNLGIAGGNNITISQSTGAASTNLTISGAAQSAQTQSNIQGIAASNTTYNTGTVQFTGSNMVTVKSAGGQQVVIDATQSVQTQNAVDATLAGNTAGVLALISSGTMTLAGGNAMTLSQAGNAVTISNQAMQLGQIQPNFGPEVVVTNAVPQGTVSLQPISAGEYLSASRLALGVQQSGTAAGVSVSQSIHAGVYTMNGASLSLASSASANLSFAGNTNNSGLRTMGATWNITPGFYVFALFQSSTSAGTAGTAGLYFNGTSLGSFIDATNAFSMLPANGYLGVTSASLRGSLALSDTGTYIRHSASVSRQPWFQLWGS